jgi:hypothetical protein
MCQSPEVRNDCPLPLSTTHSSVRAHALLAPLLWFLFGSVVLIIGLTFLSPWTDEYTVRTGAKNACNAVIKNTKQQAGVVWEPGFLSAARQGGVNLTPQQYSFEAHVTEHKDNIGSQLLALAGQLPEPSWTCEADIVYEANTPWVVVSFFYPQLKPLHQIRRIHLVHTVKDKY